MLMMGYFAAPLAVGVLALYYLFLIELLPVLQNQAMSEKHVRIDQINSAVMYYSVTESLIIANVSAGHGQMR
jgi:hypothetical protein